MRNVFRRRPSPDVRLIAAQGEAILAELNRLLRIIDASKKKG